MHLITKVDQRYCYSYQKRLQSRNLVLHHITVNEKPRKGEFNKQRKGNITDALTSIDNQEIVEIVRRVSEIYDGKLYKEMFKVSSFRSFVQKAFKIKKKKIMLQKRFRKKLVLVHLERISENH